MRFGKGVLTLSGTFERSQAVSEDGHDEAKFLFQNATALTSQLSELYYVPLCHSLPACQSTEIESATIKLEKNYFRRSLS